MAVSEQTKSEFDMELFGKLITQEEAKLAKKHQASLDYFEIARKHIAGGVASSWQASPPHAVFVERGLGNRIWDIDGNEYIDYHLGYGAMVMGHAHPKVVEAIAKQAALGTHFAQPTKHLDAIGENLADRFGLPLWRFANSGTEATLEAVRLMRAKTGRDMIIKIEGSYHGHHDSLMFSVYPDADQIGPREHPITLPQVPGLPQVFADLVRCIPFNDLGEAQRAFDENPGKIAGVIVEPAMMNCGIVLPFDGYLQGLKDMAHRNGAYLAFDEVKTGTTLAYGGATEVFGVTPDVVCLAKAVGGGVPCGAIGATEELFGMVVTGDYQMAGTYNGNPLTMAASKVVLTEILVDEAYETFNHIDARLKAGLNAVIAKYDVPAHVKGIGAKGSVIYSRNPVNEYRDVVGIDENISYLAWLFQVNRGVFKSPWTKSETWTLSVDHTDADADRYVANFEEFAAAITGN